MTNNNQNKNTMKKFLFFSVAILIAITACAQNFQPAPLIQVRTKTILDKDLTTSNGPVKLITLPDTKSGIQRIPFGSSFNLLTLLEPYNNNCVYDPDLNYMMFTHRAGGTDGGASGDIRCHYTPYFGTSIGSAVFLQQGNNRMRYPCGVIFNPNGNTVLANAMAIITGPCTDGTNWVNNFFATQKLDGSSIKFHFEPTYDTLKAPNLNLTVCDGGKVKAAGKVAQITSTFRYPYFYYKGGQVQGDSVSWNTTEYKFRNNYQDRLFSNDTTSWAFSPYMAFSKDGMTGYFYVMGWDASNSGITSGPGPIVWKTTDGGTTWNKMPLLDLSTLGSNLTNWIKPTYHTLYSATKVYRPGIMSGSTTEEGNFPGIVDNNGNLHIATMIEGMYSNNPDSLLYSYLYHGWRIFDLYTTNTGWGVNLVDTIHAGIDKAATLTDKNLDHNFHIAKSLDATKLFFMWTDTRLDTSNYLPDIYARGYDLTTGYATPPVAMTFQGDYYFFNASQQAVDSSGTFFLPATFAVISGTDINAEPTHNFIKGMKFSPSDFNVLVGVNENETSAVSVNSVSIYPNPMSDKANINLSIDKAAEVQISVSNLLGSDVYHKNYGKLIAGEHRLTLNTNSLNSGIYFVSVQAGSERVTKKIVVE
jgi:hypothetical protein